MNRIQWWGLIFLGTMFVAFPAGAQTVPRETCTQEDRDSIKPYTKTLDAVYNSPSTSALYKTPPYVASGLHSRAGIFLGADLPACALQDINEAIRLVPDSYMLLAWRGMLNQVLGHLDLALRDFNQALAIAERGVTTVGPLTGVGTTADQRIATVLPSRASLYAQRQQWALAIADYDRIIAMTQNEMGLAMIKPHRAKAYLALGRTNEAIADCSAAIAYSERTHGRASDAYTVRADAEMAKGDFAQAVLDYDQAIRQIDDGERMMAATISQASPAVAAMIVKPSTAAITFMNKEHGSVLFRSCQAKTAGGWAKAAVLDCQRSLKLRPDDAKTYEALGLAFEKVGDRTAAAEAFQHAVALDPNSASAKRGLKRVAGH